MSEKNLALLKNFAAAWNHHDLDALMNMMTDDCIFHTVAGDGLRGTTHKGPEAVAKAFEQAWLTCPDAQWTDFVGQVDGNFGFYEFYSLRWQSAAIFGLCPRPHPSV